MQTSTAPCPICASVNTNLVRSIKTINPNSDTIVSLVGCKNCKHWYVDPRPTQGELSRMYQDNSEFVVPRGYSELMSSVPHFASEALSDLLPNNEFNYLEIGIGSGQIFNYFKTRAKVAYGVEPGKWFVGERETVVSDISEIKDMKFDLIVANDVLEHLNDPSEMILQLKSLANAGCIIFATFPNKDSMKAQILKEKWSMIRPFGHLHFFSKKSAKKAFEQSGWVDVKVKAIRAGRVTTMDLIRNFDSSQGRVLYRLLSSLIPGQIILGRDQWQVIAKCSDRNIRK